MQETPKFKIEAQVESMSDEDSLCGSRLVEGVGELCGVSYKDTSPSHHEGSILMT